jgi:hypothetical protein
LATGGEGPQAEDTFAKLSRAHAAPRGSRPAFRHKDFGLAEPSFYHTWYLKPQGDACLVVTDEVGKGKDAAHLRETDESLMHRGHDLWLATLKWVSEGK